MTQNLMCMIGRHRWGMLEASDAGQRRTCDRCGRTKYVSVPPTQGSADTYGSSQPPKG